MNEENDSPEPRHFDDGAYRIANAMLDADTTEFTAEELLEKAQEFYNRLIWEAHNRRANSRRFGV